MPLLSQIVSKVLQEGQNTIASLELCSFSTAVDGDVLVLPGNVVTIELYLLITIYNEILRDNESRSHKIQGENITKIWHF
jgi:hypothetical protein